jgi:hypothetical protein
MQWATTPCLDFICVCPLTECTLPVSPSPSQPMRGLAEGENIDITSGEQFAAGAVHRQSLGFTQTQRVTWRYLQTALGTFTALKEVNSVSNTGSS